MQHILMSGNAPEGFLKTVAGSAALHAVLLLAGLLLYKAEPERVFFSPVYTVNLVAGEAGKALSQPLKEPGPEVRTGETAKAGEAAKPEAPVKKKEALKATLPVKGLAVKAKGRAKKGSKDNPMVEKALKRVSERVKRKEESGLVEERIEAIRKKTEGDRTGQGIEDIRKGLSAKAIGTDNALGSGNALSGVFAAPAGGGVRAGNLEVKYPSYFSMLRDKVQEEWKYPEEFKKDNISVIVSVRIGKTGKLLQAWVEKSSGNSAFDESLVIAVNRAAPYPPLPADFEESYLETGLRFCPSCE
ncbi:MAG: cell envelope integrity protein TolA [Deltaproteobacteria bacterium]|nr:cell envelope integrity protein TolA [Deltaproteobacteria bacterium]